ncbi:PREDICTED: serine/threonine-protein phosphatase 4 regulatory subunit 2 [Diuraphis noxia]|uniref:serine/threonine-protein phosphatase 4 regulatory subunit 2 n=1 Tax=Diuraphis noxia TaxID=143948 RepID=UPI0007639653|nr:PREDICTED: serine/threonine-protein phosphatase 4 regulatory subunit 2 [Diuraphis noxia]
MIENAELVMQMLEMYQMYKQQVPVELEEYLRYVAKTGNTLFQWTLVKPFIREKIMNVIAEFVEQSSLSDIPPYPNVDPFNYEAMKTMLLERFDTFNGPPFTIQRLCELLSCPRKEYNRVDKFMRAVEKNILVVSTCDLRPKREEPIVNGAPDRWENGKEPDISMELVDKNNVITDANVLNGNDTVESLLNELESMKTPETKLDESNLEHKDLLVAQVTDKVESNITPEEPKQDTPILITQDTPLQTQITESTSEVIEPVNIDVQPVNIDIPQNVTVDHDTIVDQPKELNSEVSEIQSVEVKEQTVSNPIDELKGLSQNIELEIAKSKTEESILESNKLDNLELIPTDVDRVEGSIIHQTSDSDNKVELDIESSQPAVLLEKSDENLEKMDVQIEDVSKIMESEVISDNIQEECIKPTEIQNDKQQTVESTIEVPTVDPISIDMEVELEKTENNIILDVIPQESVKENDDTQVTEPNTTVEEPQVQDENKLTASE